MLFGAIVIVACCVVYGFCCGCVVVWVVVFSWACASVVVASGVRVSVVATIAVVRFLVVFFMRGLSCLVCLTVLILAWWGMFLGFVVGIFWCSILGMENKSRYVVEQFWHERGTRVVVKRVSGGFRGWVGNNSGAISALSVLLVAGIGVVGAVTSVVGWNNTAWALGFVVSAVVLCVLVAGVKSWVDVPDVVVDHVFEVKGGFGPGLEDLLNNDVFWG